MTDELLCTEGRASADSDTIYNYYSYDDDKLHSINHNGFNYIFNYDSFGRTTSTSVAGQTLISHSYNANCTINKSTYGNGDTVSYSYDTLDRVTSLSYNDVKTYEYEYNREGQVVREKDYDNNITTEYEYDLAQRLTGAYSSDGVRANYTYDERNNIQNLDVTKNGTVLADSTFTYQDDGLLNSVSLPLLDNSTLSYTYDNLNRTSKKLIDLPSEHLTDYSSQIYTEYHYLSRVDSVNRTLVQTGLVSGMTVVSAINDNGDEFECDWYTATHTYDANGNITAVKQNGMDSQTYTYDGLNQLIRHDDCVAGASYTYSYDEGGNIVSKSEYDYTTGELGEPVETVNYTYDSAWKDKLISYDGKAITYDEIGNPLTYDGYTFSWQKGRQLESISGNGVNLSFKYNSDGLRTKKISSTSTTEYYYSGDILLAQYDGTDWMKFTYSADGEVVGLRYKDKSYYYIKNLQGDVIGILDELADIVCDYHYDAWGQCTISIPAGLSDDAIELANKNPIRYRGYYYDTETNLYYLQSRYYNPEWGRFVNEDELLLLASSSSLNIFSYCDNNPINFSDPTGLLKIASIYQVELSSFVKESNLSVVSATKTNSNKLPLTGEPNSTVKAPNGNEREYGSDGRAKKDTDYSHPNHHPDLPNPHSHDWTWNNGIPERGEPYAPNEFSLEVATVVYTFAVVYIVANDITGVGVADNVLLMPAITGLGSNLVMLFEGEE